MAGFEVTLYGRIWVTPEARSVFVAWIVPFALFLISMLASGTSALLGSVTTPVNPPEVVVWALTSTNILVARYLSRMFSFAISSVTFAGRNTRGTICI
jgi:hypothetical protein